MVETTKNDRPNTLSLAFYAAHRLRMSKSDYGDIESYFPFGEKSYCHDILKKAKRLVNLIKTQIKPNHESIEDNLLDLINYASFYWEFLQKEVIKDDPATVIQEYGYQDLTKDPKP